MGVWIETSHYRLPGGEDESHPVWVCGLKPMAITARIAIMESHPVWVCGLKHR